MTSYIIRRLIQSVVIILLITVIVFLVMRLLPGDPIYMFISPEEFNSSSIEKIEELRHELGLDKPIIVQYGDWLFGVIRGDLGTSILMRDSVASRIGLRLPITLHIGLLSFVIGTFLGILLGIASALKRGKWPDTIVTIISNIGITMPAFLLGIILMYFFSLYLGVLPVAGYTSPFEDFWMSTKQIIMPVICLALFPLASTARQTRSAMLEVVRQDYIRTARGKGLSEQTIIMRHALKNSLFPIVILSGVLFCAIIGGSVLIETIFNIPGMGRLAVDSILDKDYPVVQGVVLVISTIVVLVNLIVDISYGWLDPRVHYE
ncbi:MAG: ABC transporter permease [Dehalococcoidales bacterium]|nr:ABC transporter permease [Dehalococcoidales bacterium]